MRWAVILLMGAAPAVLRAASTPVNFRLIDSQTGQVTPAMVCIMGTAQKDVRLPPVGRVATRPSTADQFYRGVRFDPDRNWVGPIRETLSPNGKQGARAKAYQLRPSLPYWREPVMYQTSGDFDIDLPAGHWRVAVQRGIEYVPVAQEFDIAEGSGPLTRTIELKRWINLPQRGWWTGDVHVHHPILEPAHREYLLHYAVAEDLHVVNILEMGDHKQTRFKQLGFGRDFRASKGDYWLVSGQEDPRSTFGHIIGLNIRNLVRDVEKYDFYDLTFRGIHQQEGALVGFAHFAWNGCDLPRGFPWYVTTGELDFIEILQFSAINTMDYYDYLNLGLRLTAAAGSDVPWGATIGEVRTVVYTGPTLDIDRWFAGIKAGHTFVTNGPAMSLTVDGQLPGSEIEKTAGSVARVQAGVWSHPDIGVLKALTLVSNDGVVKEVLNPDGKPELSFDLDLTIGQSRWLVASAVCTNGAVAHTSPVYLIVDRQPAWSTRHAPRVIARQLEAIDKIEQEFSTGADERSKGIRERLQKSRTFYQDLLKRISP